MATIGIVVAEKWCGGSVAACEVARRAGEHEFPACVATFGAELEQPVAGAENVGLVLHDNDGISCGDEPAENEEEARNVVAVEACRGLVEEQEGCGGFVVAGFVVGDFVEKFHELEALCLAARERVERLPEREISEADFVEQREFFDNFFIVSEELDCLGNRHREYLGGVFAVVAELQNFRSKTPAFADGARDKDVGQKLHFHGFPAGAATMRAATVAGVV